MKHGEGDLQEILNATGAIRQSMCKLHRGLCCQMKQKSQEEITVVEMLNGYFKFNDVFNIFWTDLSRYLKIAWIDIRGK